MTKALLIVLIFLVMSVASAGCSSQTESSSDSNVVIPSPTIKDLHNVKFHITDQNGTPIYNALIFANYNSSAYSNQLNTPNNNRGYTDEYGNYSFVMRGSIKYKIIVSNLKNEKDQSIEINPTDTEYIWRITPEPTPNPQPVRENGWEHINDNNWFLGIAKGICSVIPTVNQALNC